MQLLKMSLMILLTISISGCKDDLLVERCPVQVEFQTCRCHDYKITRQFIGRVSDSRDNPLEYCDRHVSFSTEDYIKILEALEEERPKSRESILLDRENLRD